MTAHGCVPRTTMAIACVSALLAGGCHRNSGPEAAASAATAAATPDLPVRAAPRSPAGPPRLHLDEAQLGQIKIEELATRSGGDVIRATGTVEFNADRIARILAPVAGQVQELKLNVGDDVRRGDTVFVLSSREVASAIADHLASQKDLDLSEKTYAMTKDLFEHQAASRIAMQQSENDVAKARAKVAQTAEVLRVLGFDEQAVENSGPLVSHVPIKAPISGTVTERTITSGQFVGVESTALMTIADVSSVWVQADVFERDLHSIAAGEKADVTTAAYPDDHFSAQVSRVGTVVDAQTRTAKIRFVTANPGLRLKPGMFATATLQIPGASPTALTAPAKAVFVEGGKSFAYVQTGPLEFERREVDTVPAGSTRVRVTRGLSAGDRVVADGVLLLRARETDGSSE
ncbi:MAG TPA: efflux RND transporter periplasmic adaptor subunit [Vicinamibacterales bacterium]|nr:efflux RND transporter periplasmic adaptor subunit [Vicinamibacterales bacterium]